MSKRQLGLFTILAVLASLLLPLGMPRAQASTQDFEIESFTADYYLDRRSDGVPTMKVQEKIVAVFPDFDQNHGILRAIPKTYKDQPLDLKITGVTSQWGNAWPYSTSTSNDNLVLKIGSASRYVRGTQVYNISYQLKNPITFYDDHDELYWNVNGNDWSQPFGAVTARIHIPASLNADLKDDQLCYTGLRGSTAQDCTINRSPEAGGTLVTVTADNLDSGQNMSFVLGFNQDTFKPDLAAHRLAILRNVALIMLLAGPIIWSAFYIYIRWNRVGRDAKGRGTIVPQYVPPKGLNSLTSDVVLGESLSKKAVSAMMIELAVQKVLIIRETTVKKLGRDKTDYELELRKPLSSLGASEQAAAKLFFTAGTVGEKVALADLKTKLATKYANLARSISADLTSAGYFTNNPVKVTGRYYGAGSGLFGVGLFISLLLTQVSLLFLALGIGLIVGGFLFIVFAKAMSARTPKGVEVFEYLQGLKMYMELAEADRLRYLQSPEGVRQWGDPSKPVNQLKLFEKLLPYAMIFGIEKGWAKQFEDLYTEAPSWYQGSSRPFTTGYLIGSLGSFNSASTAAFMAPSSSGSSGFGGGGFSGGGGGGGGGGGW
ncbi:MAG: hypothetical protein QG553_385 [Patescibacteria group bacterium]|nr:hypothetical protein [Patescibacteria group bacterium]